MAGNVIPFPRRPSPDEPVDPDGRGEAATPGFVDSLSAADRVVIVTMSGRRHYAAEQPHEVRRGDPTRWAKASTSTTGRGDAPRLIGCPCVGGALNVLTWSTSNGKICDRPGSRQCALVGEVQPGHGACTGPATAPDRCGGD